MRMDHHIDGNINAHLKRFQALWAETNKEFSEDISNFNKNFYALNENLKEYDKNFDKFGNLAETIEKVISKFTEESQKLRGSVENLVKALTEEEKTDEKK